MRQANCFSCFATGAVAVAVMAAVFAVAWSSHVRVSMASTVHGPLLSALADLHASAERGELGEVARKTDQLKRCWEAFAYAEGESPELFVARLVNDGHEPVCDLENLSSVRAGGK